MSGVRCRSSEQRSQHRPPVFHPCARRHHTSSADHVPAPRLGPYLALDDVIEAEVVSDGPPSCAGCGREFPAELPPGVDAYPALCGVSVLVVVGGEEHLAQLVPILTAAGPSLSERPMTANLALAVLLLMQNDPDHALDVGREIAEHSTAIQLRAYTVRLQSLATNQPDLAGIDDLIAVFILTRSEGAPTGGHVSES